jgi:hypothetical protein
MAHTQYRVSRGLGPLWKWEIVQGPAAPARGVALGKAGARWAARSRVRSALQHQVRAGPRNGPGDADARL